MNTLYLIEIAVKLISLETKTKKTCATFYVLDGILHSSKVFKPIKPYKLEKKTVKNL